MSTYTDASLIVTPNAKKAGKLYSLKGADLDVVRATTATYVGSDGLIKTALANVPRLDYSNRSCPSILVEPQRTNLVFPSATATTQSRTVTATAHTLSFYGTGTVVLSGVATGTLVGTGINNKVSLTFTATAGSLILTVTGSVVNWQLEAGSNATSHIPTTTATVTRNADVISKSGISNLIGQTEGTFYSEIQFFEGGARFNGIELFGNSVNRINIAKDTNDLITVGFQANSIFTTAGIFNSSYNKIKIAIRYKSGNSVVYVNGVNVGSSSAIFNFTATLTTLNCNVVSNTIYTIHGRLLSCAVFPLGLTNSELQKLTTL